MPKQTHSHAKKHYTVSSIGLNINKHWYNGVRSDSGYHVRSLAETTMFRLKTIFGNERSARLLETQTTLLSTTDKMV